ncbi:hypothetical protein CJ030_MR6G003736 [Morella rubra]|uniref:Uncharacterized protein n=1 Tax=Morella rubra TaxID=262757 RepID=A0A6A1WSM9_9ROSI|nr:hypothetical protein CJ030_MR6G003736 [Morella rubra]
MTKDQSSTGGEEASKAAEATAAEEEGLESTTVAGEEWLESTTVPVGDRGAEDAGGSATGVEEGGEGSATEETQQRAPQTKGQMRQTKQKTRKKRKCPTAEHPHQREGELSDAGEKPRVLRSVALA